MVAIHLSWMWHSLVCLLFGQFISATMQFENSRTLCQDQYKCCSIYSCAAYQTRASIRDNPPVTCGFSGFTPLVCCPDESTSQPDTRQNLIGLLPSECGDPNRTLYNLPPPPPPPCPDDIFPNCPYSAYNGFPAKPGKWPWMVLLGKRQKDGSLDEWFCGGTLITDRHVLTAAHCLQPQQVTSVGARLGDYDLSTDIDVAHEDRYLASVTRHPQYRGAQNDITVLRLDRPVEVSDSIRPICLPPAGAEHAGSDVDVAGWGYLEFAGELPDVLQEVPLRVSDEQTCERIYSRLSQFSHRFPGGFQGTKICAVSRDDEPRDACPGDSGGPLMAPRTGGTYELVGIVSLGVGCGNPEFPGVYTKVSAYIDWILANIV